MNRFLSICFALFCSSAFAQTGSPIKQSGNVTPTHGVCWVTNGVAGDCGTAAIPFLTSIGAVYNGPSICAWSALSTSGAAQELCLGATTAGGAQITVQNYGTASALPLSLSLNGTIYQFPFSTSGVIGPVSSTIGDVATWANSAGTLLGDTPPLQIFGTESANAVLIGPTAGSATYPTFRALTSVDVPFARPQLSSSTILYVSNAGTDSGACTIGSPCATIPYAINYIQKNYDLAGYTATISLAAGTYAGFSVNGNGVGGACNLIIQGSTSQSITAATNANPIVVTYTGADPSNGDNVVIKNVAGNTAANGSWVVASVNTSAKTFALTNSTGSGAYTSGGTFYDTTSVVIAGGATYAVDVENFGCVTINGGVKLTSTGQSDINVIRFGKVIVSNALELGGSGSGVGMVYGARYGYVELDGGIAISATSGGPVLQGDHTGNIRWNGTIMGFTANTTISYAVGGGTILFSDGGDITETGGGSIAFNSYTITVAYGSYSINNGFVQVEGYAPPQSSFFNSVPSSAATAWSTNTPVGSTTGILQEPSGFYIYGGSSYDVCWYNTAGSILHQCIDSSGNNLLLAKSAPSASSSGYGYSWFDSTDLQLHSINSSGTVATTVVHNTCSGLNVVTAISASGVITCSNPSGGAQTYLCTITASASSSINNASPTSGSCPLNSTYTSYRLVFQNLVSATNEKIMELQVHSASGGASYKTSGYLSNENILVNGVNSGSSGITTYIPITFPVDAQSNSLASGAPGFSGEVTIINPSAAALIMVYGNGAYLAGSGAVTTSTISGYWNTSAAVDGFQVLMDSGNLTSGSILVYGIQ